MPEETGALDDATASGPAPSRLRAFLTRGAAAPAGAAAALFALRVSEGLIWFWGASMNNPWEGWERFDGWVHVQAIHSEIPPYKWFLENVVQAYPTFWHLTQFIVEGGLAVTLILGLFTGWASLLAFAWTANLIIGSYAVPNEPLYLFPLWGLAPLAVWATRAGRYAGLDARLRPRLLEHPNAIVRWAARWGM